MVSGWAAVVQRNFSGRMAEWANGRCTLTLVKKSALPKNSVAPANSELR
jgi:hypothetical protein